MKDFFEPSVKFIEANNSCLDETSNLECLLESNYAFEIKNISMFNYQKIINYNLVCYLMTKRGELKDCNFALIESFKDNTDIKEDYQTLEDYPKYQDAVLRKFNEKLKQGLNPQEAEEYALDFGRKAFDECCDIDTTINLNGLTLLTLSHLKNQNLEFKKIIKQMLLELSKNQVTINAKAKLKVKSRY